MTKLIKDFENFSKKQALANGQTQWVKKYDDGESAYLCIDNSGVTRQKVRDEFSEQEYQNSDAGKEEIWDGTPSEILYNDASMEEIYGDVDYSGIIPQPLT